MDLGYARLTYVCMHTYVQVLCRRTVRMYVLPPVGGGSTSISAVCVCVCVGGGGGGGEAVVRD